MNGHRGSIRCPVCDRAGVFLIMNTHTRGGVTREYFHQGAAAEVEAAGKKYQPCVWRVPQWEGVIQERLEHLPDVGDPAAVVRAATAQFRIFCLAKVDPGGDAFMAALAHAIDGKEPVAGARKASRARGAGAGAPRFDAIVDMNDFNFAPDPDPPVGFVEALARAVIAVPVLDESRATVTMIRAAILTTWRAFATRPEMPFDPEVCEEDAESAGDAT